MWLVAPTARVVWIIIRPPALPVSLDTIWAPTVLVWPVSEAVLAVRVPPSVWLADTDTSFNCLPPLLPTPSSLPSASPAFSHVLCVQALRSLVHHAFQATPCRVLNVWASSISKPLWCLALMLLPSTKITNFSWRPSQQIWMWLLTRSPSSVSFTVQSIPHSRSVPCHSCLQHSHFPAAIPADNP